MSEPDSVAAPGIVTESRDAPSTSAPYAIAQAHEAKGSLQLLRLADTVTFQCLRCERNQHAGVVGTLDGNWEALLCKNCFSHVAGKKEGQRNADVEKLRGKFAAPGERPPVRVAPRKRERESEPEERVKRPAGTKKKAVALLFGYLGTRFAGLQINPGVHTVEEDLLKALALAKYIPPTRPDEMFKIHWQRASRTDKGVHAVRNVLSLRLWEYPDITTEKSIEAINAELSPDIRILGLKNVTNNFNSRLDCTHRDYHYICPTYTFLSDYFRYFPAPATVDALPLPADMELPADAGKKPRRSAEAEGDGGEGDGEGEEEPCNIEDFPLPDWTSGAAEYRMPAETLENVRALLNQFVGTHSYHNFTKRMKSSDGAAKRFITSFTCSDPYELNGMEVVRLEVKGQSFLLNQIRKMIGIVMIIVSGQLGAEALEYALDPKNAVNVPPAPGTGLMLNDLQFESYNNRLLQLKTQGCTGLEGREPLTWEDCPAIIQLKNKIAAEIVTVEREAKPFLRWMYALERNVILFMKTELKAPRPAASQ
eukprot:TRINITY_DN7903_c0_g1_i1.p1 TRINITY_DN7903_c0_g1~~TRINITY_DN7903_c0_g1_i1.p1  ORF type:complete len:546 (-),score=81.82 TRINITY_DN7903_c0_g1_i1:24-1634(-)